MSSSLLNYSQMSEIRDPYFVPVIWFSIHRSLITHRPGKGHEWSLFPSGSHSFFVERVQSTESARMRQDKTFCDSNLFCPLLSACQCQNWFCGCFFTDCMVRVWLSVNSFSPLRLIEAQEPLAALILIPNLSVASFKWIYFISPRYFLFISVLSVFSVNESICSILRST